ncbi:MAG: hypothetical protein LC799_29260, partial [Actinobacteria bacterium]|nr:hypothetical protein [Actinomycetota bacterium]
MAIRRAQRCSLPGGVTPCNDAGDGGDARGVDRAPACRPERRGGSRMIDRKHLLADLRGEVVRLEGDLREQVGT